MDIDTVITRKYRCWMPEEWAIEARKERMTEEFIKVASAGITLSIPIVSNDKYKDDDEYWNELARAQMGAHMQRYRPNGAGTIYANWFNVERVED